ncbi:MAG: multidrug effflux MFS transporter [Deltaproteobacteria bacterium]
MSNKFTKREQKWVFGLAFAVIILSWMSIKISMPALPKLSEVFHSAPGGVKLSVTIFFIFFAVSQPVWGGITQKIGCRPTLLIGILVSIAGSLIAMLAFDLPSYIIGRGLEGLGMGSASPVARTMLTDVFDRKYLARSMGTISGTASIMPALAPIIGGYLLTWIDWRAIFGFFLILSVLYFALAYRDLPETRFHSDKDPRPTTPELLGYYLSILKNTSFWGYALCYAVMTGGLLGYYSAAPYWFVSQLGIAANHYAFLTVPTVVLYIFGLFVNRMLLKRYDLEKLLFLGISSAVLTAILTLGLAFANASGLIVIIVLLSLFGFSAGLVMPAVNAGAMARFKKVAGPASALLVMTVFGMSSITASWAMRIDIGTLWPVALYLGVLSLIGLFANFFWVWLPYKNNVREEIH